MKQYSNSSRKPMMYGGMTKPKKKMEAGGKAMADAKANADVQSRVATGRATQKDKAAMQKQRMEELGRMTIPELRKIANGSDSDAMMARSVLRAKGDKGAMPPGDQQPAGKMMGGKARKKMAEGGKTYTRPPKAENTRGKLPEGIKDKIIAALRDTSPPTASQKAMIRKYTDMLPDSLKKKADKVLSTTDASTATSYTPNDKKMYGGMSKKNK